MILWLVKYVIAVVICIALAAVVIVVGLLAILFRAIYRILMFSMDILGDHLIQPIAEWGTKDCPWRRDHEIKPESRHQSAPNEAITNNCTPNEHY